MIVYVDSDGTSFLVQRTDISQLTRASAIDHNSVMVYREVSVDSCRVATAQRTRLNHALQPTQHKNNT